MGVGAQAERAGLNALAVAVQVNFGTGVRGGRACAYSLDKVIGISRAGCSTVLPMTPCVVFFASGLLHR